MEKDKIPCPSCEALNEPIGSYCYDCGSSLHVSTTSEIITDIQNNDYDSPTEFNGPERHFIFEINTLQNIQKSIPLQKQSKFNSRRDYRKSNALAFISSYDTNLFTNERQGPSGFIAIFVGFFVIMFSTIILALISPVFILIGPLIGFSILILSEGHFIYFNAYDTRSHSTDSDRMKVIQRDHRNYKIGLKGKYFVFKNLVTRKDWVLSDGKGMKICSTNFTSGLEGFLETSEDNFIISSVSTEKKGICSVYNKSGIRLITITNPQLDQDAFQSRPKKFEILSSPDLDECIIMFFSFVIIRKLLNIK